MSNEMMQRTFNEDVMPKILNANESHMACLMLLDTSGSMAGTPIDELNKGLNKFREDVCKDDTTKEVLDVAVVEFNSDKRVVQNFVPVPYMEPVNLGAGGGTNMSPAIRTAIDMVNGFILITNRFFFIDNLGRNISIIFNILIHHFLIIFKFSAALLSIVLFASSLNVTSKCQCILSTLQWPLTDLENNSISSFKLLI